MRIERSDAMPSAADCLWPLGAALGEGPLWSARERSVWFVDIKRQSIHRYRPHAGGQSFTAPASPSFIVPLAGSGYVVGLKTGLHYFDPVTCRFELFAIVESPELNNRLNDAHVDANGRLWFGSMHDDEINTSGVLYRLTAQREILRMDAGYRITNGPTTSPDGRTLYHTDTSQRLIYAFDLSEEGHLSNKRVFVRIARASAVPDGLSMDAAGCLLVALYGGWGIERYSPRGELIEFLPLPCANVTKAVFGDDDLRTLYITTASQGLDAAARTAQPLAGGLFALRVNTPGLPQHEVRLEPMAVT